MWLLIVVSEGSICIDNKWVAVGTRVGGVVGSQVDTADVRRPASR